MKIMFSCYGKEGRGEQIPKQDQDNALILADDCTISDENSKNLLIYLLKTLVDFGFPRCQGNIMVSNPYWCKKSDLKT